MTPEQRRILGPRVKVMLSQQRHAWWELKRQIFESGGSGAGVYHWASFFRDLSSQLIGRLADPDKAVLVVEWKRKHAKATQTTDQAILAGYDAVIAEEVVRRAEIASNRTINW